MDLDDHFIKLLQRIRSRSWQNANGGGQDQNVSGPNGKLGEEKWIKYYSSSHKILLVGEGDFSFSACLANAFGSANNMIATSLDTKEFLLTSYRNAIANISELETRGCKVMHGLDARRMAYADFLWFMKFERIVFNFPHAGYITGSRSIQLKQHRDVMKLFFENAKKLLLDDGEVNVVHKCNGFFLGWNLAELASMSGLHLIEEMEFSLDDYPGYQNKYGYCHPGYLNKHPHSHDSNFNCEPSKTYKFGISWSPFKRPRLGY